MGRHEAGRGAGEHPIVAAALASRGLDTGGAHRKNRPRSAASSPLGWPGKPAPRGGQGWPERPGDADADAA